MTKKSIREYEGIYPSQDLSIDDFNSLKDLIRENSSVEYPRVMTVCSDLKNGLLGLQAVNYVGTIGFSDGNSLEILPKIASVEGDDTLYSADRAKSIFLEMLMDTRYKPKEYQKTGLGHATTDVLEFFIQRYIENIRAIIRNGVAFSYYDIEVNDRYLRGSLDFPNHIKLNLVHKERFYIRTQLFGPNRPENRIIKSTLMHLYKITGDSINKRDLNDLLNCFEDIPFSTNIDADARKISIDRNMNTYQGVLDWSLLFIKNKSFDLFCGKNISYALIFPMELLYQEYIRSKIISLSRGRYTV